MAYLKKPYLNFFCSCEQDLLKNTVAINPPSLGSLQPERRLAIITGMSNCLNKLYLKLPSLPLILL